MSYFSYLYLKFGSQNNNRKLRFIIDINDIILQEYIQFFRVNTFEVQVLKIYVYYFISERELLRKIYVVYILTFSQFKSIFSIQFFGFVCEFIDIGIFRKQYKSISRQFFCYLVVIDNYIYNIHVLKCRLMQL